MDQPESDLLDFDAQSHRVQSNEPLISGTQGLRILEDLDVSFDTFNPLETERIAGIPHALQRLWRHRGHLGFRPRNAMARYNSSELAELCVRYRLSICSLSPAKSAELGRRAGRIVLLAAVSLGDGAVQVVGPATQTGKVVDEFSRDPGLAAAICGIKWGHASRYLWSADGKTFTFGSLEDLGVPANRHELLMLIDLVAMGARIASDARRPLVTLTCPAANDNAVICRRTMGLNVVPEW
jgi:hypothetical protein